MLLALFLTINSTSIRPFNCNCRRPNQTEYCYIRGCSNGTNGQCNTGKLYNTNYAALSLGFSYRGCNCPGTPSNVMFNGFFDSSVLYGETYNYTNCTNFGTNARDSSGGIPAKANEATDCCNFCCNRNDPYAETKTTIDD